MQALKTASQGYYYHKDISHISLYLGSSSVEDLFFSCCNRLSPSHFSKHQDVVFIKTAYAQLQKKICW